ncbi:MAG: OprO/OprP family phosphate-selective porin, partial [Clostridium sp.]|nr:OprO/OprP family phosphate-selective porin [Clostridium sp.]
MFALMGTAAVAQTNDLETRVADLESSVKKMNQLKLSGYVQAQWKWDQSKVDAGSQNDFSVRRGRLKSTYSNAFGEAVLQIDITESGVGIKDAYLKFKDPRVNWVALQAGVFDRPFGYEISYSSSRRESPERSKIFLTLFPKERDLGAALEFKGPKGTTLQNFSLTGGLFTGNGGAAKETDSGKDFIGHLAYNKKFTGVDLGLGFSLYEG